jgi:S-formylglutathione hydrolase FrmB
VLQDNGGDNLSVTANGSFTFATPLVSGTAYSVTVKTNPAGQTCTVSNGSGTVGSGNVTSVAVSCGSVPTYTVGGSVSGLSGTVVLQDNGGDNLSVTANGSFTFATSLPTGAAYSVTVQLNPAGQTCTVSNGSGTMGSANVTNVAVSCAASAASASDDFNRANGGLGANWTAVSDGGMAIASQQVTGTAGAVTGDMWSGSTLGSDQYSEVQVTSTPLTGIQWIGAAVRMQNGGQNGYVGIYSWNSGTPVLELFERSGGGWAEVGAYSSGPLAAGTKLRLVALGNSISFMVNGVQRIGLSDSSFSGGAPGIMAYDSATGDNWSAGTAGFQVSYQSTDGQGVKSYDVLSTNDGYGPQDLRVLAPTNPAAGVAHNFLIVLPVQSGLQTTFGDGLTTLEGVDAQDQYNLTIIEPTFAIDPWYADNPNDQHLQYETFMTQELVPWIKQNLATTGQEQVWLLGFSKSGIGGQDLILKHPDLFTLAASWDLPADMSSYDFFGANSAQNYGTDANFQANYRLTTAFVDSHKAPFLSNNRIWIGGYNLYQPDDADYDALLTSEGVVHSLTMQAYPAHSWSSGWVPAALAALYQDSLNQH